MILAKYTQLTPVTDQGDQRLGFVALLIIAALAAGPTVMKWIYRRLSGYQLRQPNPEIFESFPGRRFYKHSFHFSCIETRWIHKPLTGRKTLPAKECQKTGFSLQDNRS